MQSIIVLNLHLLLNLSQSQVSAVEGLIFRHRMVVLACWYLCVYVHIWCHVHSLYDPVLQWLLVCRPFEQWCSLLGCGKQLV